MTSQPGPAPPASAIAAVGGFYFLFFMAVGLTLPFVPEYLRTLGLDAGDVGLLLAVNPIFAIVGPPLWGAAADRLGRPGLVLFVLAAGAAAGYGLLAQASSFAGALGALCLQASFGASVTTVADALALERIRHTRVSYAHLRACGSLGFVVSTLVFGFAVERIDVRAVVAAALVLAVCAVFTGLTLARAPAVRRSGPAPSIAAMGALLRHREIAFLLAASALHWIACAPYHAVLTLHLEDLAHSPRIVSLSSSVAVSSELVVMLSFPRWGGRASPKALLAAAFLASALRWACVAATDDAVMLVASAALHGLTFGCFYVAAVAWMTERTPPSLRASGQALFVASTFGIGGLVGFTGAGQGYQHLGGHTLFALAAALELAPLALVTLAGGARRKPA